MNKASALVVHESTPRTLFVGLVAMALCGGLAYLVSSGWERWFPQPVFEARMDQGCDLHQGPCTARFGDGGQVTLDIEPKTIQPMQPLILSLSFEDVHVENVSVDFRGARMNMGDIPAEVTQVGNGRFAGGAVLPVCIRNKMTWSARISADSARGIRRATFEFDMFKGLNSGP